MIHSEQWFRFSFWKHKWWDLKYAIKNFITYRKIVARTRPWDKIYIIEMLKFQIELNLKNLKKKSSLQECDETRIPKVKKMEHVIELLNNVIEDNFDDRCGYDPDATEIKFVSTDDGMFEMVSEVLKEGYDSTEVYKKSEKLQEKEWNELFNLIKNELQGWWN